MTSEEFAAFLAGGLGRLSDDELRERLAEADERAKEAASEAWAYRVVLAWREREEAA